MRINKLQCLGTMVVLSTLFAQGIGRADVTGQNQPAKRLAPKRFVEQPLERLISVKTTGDETDSFQNPKVEPGKVRWHANMEMACQASRKSGKPVLLFQMMGRLDDRFC